MTKIVLTKNLAIKRIESKERMRRRYRDRIIDSFIIESGKPNPDLVNVLRSIKLDIDAAELDIDRARGEKDIDNIVRDVEENKR